MSVLIKEMKMPKDCPMCPLSHWNALGQFTGCEIVGGKRYAMTTDPEYAKSSIRPDWCPLIEVPTPHGRLIEEPKSLSYAGLAYISRYDAVEIAEYFGEQIKNQPTVIEAENSDET